MCVATIPLGFFCMAFAPWVIGLVYGTRFANAADYLAILGWVITFGYTSAVVVSPFLAWGMPRQYGNSIFAGNVANLALNLLLIPSFQAVGAAVATLAAKIAVTVLGLRHFRQATTYPVVADFSVYFAISGFALGLATIPGFLLHLPDVFGVSVFGVTYATLAFASRGRYYRRPVSEATVLASDPKGRA